MGKRIPKSNVYTHKVVDYMRIPIETEELEAINDGGVANMKWKKIKSIGIWFIYLKWKNIYNK